MSYRETGCQVYFWHTPNYIYRIIVKKGLAHHEQCKQQTRSTLCLDSLLADLEMKGRGQWLCGMLYFFISKAVDTAARASKIIMQSPINCKGVRGKGVHSVWICVWRRLSNVDLQSRHVLDSRVGGG